MDLENRGSELTSPRMPLLFSALCAALISYKYFAYSLMLVSATVSTVPGSNTVYGVNERGHSENGCLFTGP